MPVRNSDAGPATLREATAADAPAIAALHAESWRTTYRGALRDDYLDGDILGERTAVWRTRLDSPAANQRVVVAEERGRVIGFTCAYGEDDARWGTQLDNIHVDRAAHGRGTGTCLVAGVAAWCRVAHPGGSGLYLWVLEQNHPARRFYERLGATDQEGDVWLPPDGGEVKTRRYVWSRDELARLAAHGRAR
ncbi:MAG TPA: GNAT family N-acetyltransferase [Candidatus Binatia bacterium]